MCKFCRQVNCPQNCPSYGLLPPTPSNRPRRFCRICLGRIPDGDAAYRSGKRFVCYSCAEEMDIYDLMRICEIENKRDLISRLGFHAD